VILHKPGQLVMDGFINGLKSRFSAVRSELGGLTKKLPDMLDKSWGEQQTQSLRSVNREWRAVAESMREVGAEAGRLAASVGEVPDATIGSSEVSGQMRLAASLDLAHGAPAETHYHAEVQQVGGDATPDETAGAILFGLRTLKYGSPITIGGVTE
jgi:hypothetical protein